MTPPGDEPQFISARFCWTERGKSVHITDDGIGTRCGWRVTKEASADDVEWHWPPCGKCSNRR